MQRPGCVWTHSLLIRREHVSQISTPRLLASLRRPQLEELEGAAIASIVLDGESPSVPTSDGFADKTVATALVGAVLGQSRPVVVGVDTAAQLEEAFLRLWE